MIQLSFIPVHYDLHYESILNSRHIQFIGQLWFLTYTPLQYIQFTLSSVACHLSTVLRSFFLYYFTFILLYFRGKSCTFTPLHLFNSFCSGQSLLQSITPYLTTGDLHIYYVLLLFTV